jgi:hypothetical protein
MSFAQRECHAFDTWLPYIPRKCKTNGSKSADQQQSNVAARGSCYLWQMHTAPLIVTAERNLWKLHTPYFWYDNQTHSIKKNLSNISTNFSKYFVTKSDYSYYNNVVAEVQLRLFEILPTLFFHLSN